MEAWRFGFDPSLPPAFKFDPTDADLVAHYLLPRLLNLPNPRAHAVIDADPASCPPWELMRRHGHSGSDHAFFFGPPRVVTKSGAVARASRGVPAGEDGVRGKWRGQKGQGERLSLLPRGGDGEIVVTYKKYNLTYYNEIEEVDDGATTGTPSGWVMQEYQIVDPPMYPGVVLARVKVADRASKEHRKKRKEMSSAPTLPGPSTNYDYVQESDHNDGEGKEGVPAGNYTMGLFCYTIPGREIRESAASWTRIIISSLMTRTPTSTSTRDTTAPETATMEVAAKRLWWIRVYDAAATLRVIPLTATQ